MKKILIVEDDQLVATAYRKRFHEAGYEVEWAPDGLEGIKMVSGVKPDVVLLDLLMPRLDGIEVLKYIRSHADLKNLPVVVFSNSYMTNLVENAWRAGADQCLMKASTTPAQLFDVVNKAILKAASRAAAPAKAAVAETSGVTLASTPRLAPTSPLATPAIISLPQQMVNRPLATPPNVPAPVSPLPPRAVAPVQPLANPGTSSISRTGGVTPQVDPEFQEQIRQLFLNTASAKLSAIRDAANAFVQDQGSSMQIPLLNDLFRKVHSLTGSAAVAGCAPIARYGSMFEAFLQELQQKPKFINLSTVNTVAFSATFLEYLAQVNSTCNTSGAPASILIVEADPEVATAVGMALEKAECQAHSAGDPGQALAMLASNPFDAVVMAVDLPGMTGFELCAQMQGFADNSRTPVLFVTTLNDFQTHANPEVLGENDLIAKPFLLLELALKAVTLVERARAGRQP